MDDQTKSAIAEHSEQLHGLVTRVTQQALDELRLLRDQVDELIGIIIKCQESVEDDLREYAEQAKAALQAKYVMSDALVRLRDQFAKTPTLPNVHRLPTLEKGNGQDN